MVVTEAVSVAIEEAHAQVRRIVVGVDGSDSSKDALRWAARMIPVIGDELEAVIAWDYPTNYGWAIATPDDWRPDIDADKVLQAVLDEVFGGDRPQRLVATVCQGHPSAVLLDAARHATMLVVGGRGHGRFAGRLLGSVSTACAEHALCPVLVVHHKPAPA